MKKLLLVCLLLGSIQCREKPPEVEKPLCDCQNFAETGTGVGIDQGYLRFPQCPTCSYALASSRGIDSPVFAAICPDSTFLAQLTSANLTQSTLIQIGVVPLGYAGKTTLVTCDLELGNERFKAYPYHVKFIKKL
ncbi:hypothetical protein [Fibrella aquatilis]|uniref:Uncharacterized protein n=1 Tax=Fibrella aquatilis TaxID=2817059 RepID=A0A939GCI4_9BACT|nr:hypothetical protein [Fibrella aquatilis]MBO0934176.1 hypothetical protein [Fibrella aquatilis]